MARKPKPIASEQFLTVLEGGAESAQDNAGGERRSPDLDCLAYPTTLAKMDGAEHAMRAWDTINEHLTRARLISQIDVIQLEVLCAAIGRWHWCQERYRELESDNVTPKGRYYVVRGRNGKQHKTRPEVQDEREAVRVINSLGSNFGLDPVARLRLLNGSLPDPDDDDDLFA